MARVTDNDDLLGDSEMTHDGAMGNRTHLQAAWSQVNQGIEEKKERERQRRARENRVRRSQGLPTIGDDEREGADEINVGGSTMRLLPGHHTNGGGEK